MNNNPLIEDFKQLLKENDCANMSSVGGMGAIVSAQPGAVPGTPGSIGSGDVSKPLLNFTQFTQKNYSTKKKRKRKKKVNPIMETLNITKYDDMISHLDKYSNKVGEKAIQRAKDIMEWLSQYNSQFQSKDDIWFMTEIKPSLSALSNKGLLVNLKKGEKEVVLNISTGDEAKPLLWKYDEVKKETGDIKNFTEFLKI